jgi:hypothetical protein
VPPEVNVLATGLLFVVLILLALNVVVQRARGRREAAVAAVPATVGAPANA